MLLSLVLALAIAPEPSALPSEADEHNKRAMMFYDNGQLAPAFEAFHAAYASMPDAQAHRAGRESLLGSMRATLLEMHTASGEPAPLCRLQTVLHTHADALAAVYPDSPDMLEIHSARERHDEVTAQLAALGPAACVVTPTSSPPSQPDAPVTAASEPAAAPVRSPPHAKDSVSPRQLRIAGGVTLGLGAVLLGVMTYGIIGEARHERRVDEIDAGAAGRPLDPDENKELLDRRQDAQVARYLAIGTGVAAGVTTALGTTLFLLARPARMQRWTAAPWWLPGSAGLMLRVQLGNAR